MAGKRIARFIGAKESEYEQKLNSLL